jgi:hypothetical protein
MKQTIRHLIDCYSFAQVEQMHYRGQTSHFEQYCRVWEWIAPRLGGCAGLKHDSYFRHNGAARYYAKINKVRSAFGYAPIVPLFLTSATASTL